MSAFSMNFVPWAKRCFAPRRYTQDPKRLSSTISTIEETKLPDYMTDPNAVMSDAGVTWRHGRPPDYSKTRKFYSETKTQNHEAGSLPELVENLVKNWEVEASFKIKLDDWRTVDHEKYTFSLNGVEPCSAEDMLRIGTYNALIAPCAYYDSSRTDFAKSHKTFKRMMPVFAWEVVEVHTGPPIVSFKWRHWGEMKGDYLGINNMGEKVTIKATGRKIEIFGITVAHLNSKMQVTKLDTWFDSNDMFRQMDPDGTIARTEKVAIKEETLPLAEIGDSTPHTCPVSHMHGMRAAK